MRMPGPGASAHPRGSAHETCPAGSAPQPGTPQRLAPSRPGQTRLLRPETHEALPAGPPSAPRPKQALTEGRPGKRPPWAEARWAAGPNEGALRGLSRCCRAARLPAGHGPGPRSPLARGPSGARGSGQPPRVGPRPEPPPLAASPRSAFTALGRGPASRPFSLSLSCRGS